MQQNEGSWRITLDRKRNMGTNGRTERSFRTLSLLTSFASNSNYLELYITQVPKTTGIPGSHEIRDLSQHPLLTNLRSSFPQISCISKMKFPIPISMLNYLPPFCGSGEGVTDGRTIMVPLRGEEILWWRNSCQSPILRQAGEAGGVGQGVKCWGSCDNRQGKWYTG